MENKILIGVCWVLICFAFFYLGYMFGKLKNKEKRKTNDFSKFNDKKWTQEKGLILK
jgi:hypothetical protein